MSPPHLRVEVLGDGGSWAELPDKGMLVIGSSTERAGVPATSNLQSSLTGSG